MCVTFVYVCAEGEDSPFKLVVINNRDEQLDRETSNLAWEDGILAGRDEKDPARGTWLGVNKRGDVGNLLSITQKHVELNPNSQSRGAIPKNFLKGSLCAFDYCKENSENATKFNGFQFLGLNRNQNGFYDLCSLTNLLVDEIKPVPWPAGIYGFGNSPRSSSFQKVLRGEQLFKSALKKIFAEKLSVEEAIPMLTNVLCDRTKCFPDEQIGFQTGKSKKEYEFFTSLFVTSGHGYGTRSHSIFIVDNDDKATFYEKRMVSLTADKRQGEWTESVETFQLDSIAQNGNQKTCNGV